MSKKRNGDKSPGYCGEFHHKNAPDLGFQSSITELKDDISTLNPNQGDAAKFEKSSKAVSNYVMRHYDSGIILANSI